jgi:AraC family transcriptional regulator of adaptative response / DNA-3-methyladenine glycosylase II
MASKFGQAMQFGDRLTRLFPPPEVLADADLASIGLPKTRAATVRALARAVCAGEISFERLRDPQLVIKRLLEVRGIGKWTAQYVAMRALGEPDAFPSEDLGLMRGMGLHKPADVERRSQSWRPWRAYAAMYVWNVGSGDTKHSHRRDVGRRQRWTEAYEDASSSFVT